MRTMILTFVILMLCPLLASGAVERATLRGQVTNPDGQPVAGATVMIYYAGVKTGYSTFCPSCYADCGKRAATDADGRFTIADLDPDLWFQLLVVRDGYGPLFVKKVDPSAGPAKATLTPRKSPDNPACVVRGKVVDGHGNALSNVVVESEFVTFPFDGETTGRGGAVDGLDPIAVTNDNGDFEIAYTKPATNMTVMVCAPGMAPRRFRELATGTQRHTLAVGEGATIRGRLVHEGKPVPNGQIGVVSQDRASGNFISEVTIGTNPDGTFLIPSIPAPGSWYVYAKMNSVAKIGATAPIACKTTSDGQMLDVGDLTLTPGHHLRGRVVLTDGKPIPPGMRVYISLNRAWDDQQQMLGPDGRFEFDNVPSDDVSIWAAVKGYDLSKKNPNLSWSVEGLLDRDIDDFVLLMDPGQLSFEGRVGGKFKGKPLRSAIWP